MEGKGLDEVKHDVGDILGAVRIIEIAGNTVEFNDWLEEEHGITETNEILPGYKFFQETALRSLLHDVIYSSLPLIPGDFVLYRARFDGVKLSSIPNTCEKTAFIKNVNDYRRDIRKADTLEELQTVLNEFSEEVLNPFTTIFNNHSTIDPEYDIDREELIRVLTIFHLYTRFNDIQHEHPNG